jgi:two-component sensor histidine kinase
MAAPTNNHSAAERLVPKRAAEYHRRISEHLSHAARIHEKAAEDNDIGHDEAAVHDAQTASSHTIRARALAERALKAHVEHVHLRMSEISHRAKNMLSLVEAIARQTAAHQPEDFIERFSDRIRALSANQDLLIRNEWKGVDIEDLVCAQLALFADLIGSRIAVRGPKLRLKAASAQAIGLALHELATNAGKYGSLSTEMGRVDVSWGMANGTLTMRWAERDGPPVSAPQRRGFGTTVMEAMTECSVGGAVDLRSRSRLCPLRPHLAFILSCSECPGEPTLMRQDECSEGLS